MSPIEMIERCENRCVSIEHMMIDKKNHQKTKQLSLLLLPSNENHSLNYLVRFQHKIEENKNRNKIARGNCFRGCTDASCWSILFELVEKIDLHLE